MVEFCGLWQLEQDAQTKKVVLRVDNLGVVEGRYRKPRADTKQSVPSSLARALRASDDFFGHATVVRPAPPASFCPTTAWPGSRTSLPIRWQSSFASPKRRMNDDLRPRTPYINRFRGQRVKVRQCHTLCSSQDQDLRTAPIQASFAIIKSLCYLRSLQY